MFFLQPSQKRLLNSLNPLILVGIIFTVILLRTTAEPILPFAFWQWDLLLPFIVYFGQRRSLIEGLILALFASHLYSLCSSAPIGLFTLHYLCLFTVARILSYVIYANRWVTIFVLMLSLCVLGRAVLALIASLFGHSWSASFRQPELWLGIVLNAFIGYLVYWFVGLVDRMTFKTPTMNIQLSENEI